MQLTREASLAAAAPTAPSLVRRPAQGLDAHLVAARDGSAAAFESLYRALASQVVSYLRWHRVSDPDGLTNDVFAQVHRKLRTFEGDEHGFRSWVFTIAHHRMIDDRRRAHRQPVVDSDAQLDDHLSAGDAEDDAFVALGHARVQELLDMLSPDQRTVVLLRVVFDLPVEQVARMLGKREGAIKALQHRAMGALRRHLSRDPTPV